MFANDTWGGSWGELWGQSWCRAAAAAAVVYTGTGGGGPSLMRLDSDDLRQLELDLRRKGNQLAVIAAAITILLDE